MNRQNQSRIMTSHNCKIKNIEVSTVNNYKRYIISFYDTQYFIHMKMNMDASCCESFDMSSLPNEEELEQFHDAYIQNLTYEQEPDNAENYNEEHEFVVNIETTAGILKVVMTNEHNGYYPHECILTYNIMTTDNKLLNNYVNQCI